MILRSCSSSGVIARAHRFFESKVEIPLIRHGKKQKFETLINEEALLLAKFLRNERENWTPRFANVQ